MRRNGFIMRHAYPQGYEGDHVNFWCAVGRAIANGWNIWRKTSTIAEKIFMVIKTITVTLVVGFCLVVLLCYDLYHIVTRGTIMFVDDNCKEKEVRIPFLHKILPVTWIVVGMILMLGSSFLGFVYMAYHVPDFGIRATDLLMSFVWMAFLLSKFEKGHAFLMARMKDAAPSLAREMEFPRIRQSMNDCKDGFLFFVSPLLWLVRKSKVEVKVTD